MATDPAAQRATMAANLKASSGKSLGQWVTLARKEGPDTHGRLVTWLKTEHALTHGYANLVAHATLQSDANTKVAAGNDLVGPLFAGSKATLRPIYDALLAAVTRFGPDIALAPKKGYVSLRRATQFATLHPATPTRFDVGIKLRGVAAAGRLELAGAWNGMVTHRVRLATVKDVDRELVGWLRRAYDEG